MFSHDDFRVRTHVRRAKFAEATGCCPVQCATVARNPCTEITLPPK